MSDRTEQIVKKLASQDIGQCRAALGEIVALSDIQKDEKLALADGLGALFYRDEAGNEKLAQVIEKAEQIVASFGPDVAPWIMGQLDEADSESAEHFARALGQIGAQAIDGLVKAFDAKEANSYMLINLLNAVGCFTDPNIIKVLPKVIPLADSDDTQVKSAAYYCFGRMANRIPAYLVSEDERSQMFEKLFAGLSDTKALARRHAARALGKLSINSYLNDEQKEKTRKAFRAILGLDNFDWDDAYIVRSEAEYYLNHVKNKSQGKGGEGKMGKYNQEFTILEKKELCPDTFYYKVNAPLIAKKIQAGQFIIIRPNDHSERIPLSICGWDREEGYVEIIIMSAGRTSMEANAKEVGDSFLDVIGPLGQRSHVTKYDGTCVVLGGGYGTGAIIPTARDLRALGNKVIGVVGARNKDLLIMKDELGEACDELYVTTNDGSEGIEGFVTHALEKIMEKEKVSMTLAVGPVPMMMAVTNMAKDKDIEGWVSLNAIMVDGTGMCGACRVSVGKDTKFACFHGPDFLGAEVDFDELTKRQKMFVDMEKIALEAFQK